MKKILVTATILTITLITTSVMADEVKKGETPDGYGYEFDDDPLNAGGFTVNDATIVFRSGPVRTLLIRPRTSFVNELLRTVEAL